MSIIICNINDEQTNIYFPPLDPALIISTVTNNYNYRLIFDSKCFYNYDFNFK